MGVEGWDLTLMQVGLPETDRIFNFRLIFTRSAHVSRTEDEAFPRMIIPGSRKQKIRPAFLFLRKPFRRLNYSQGSDPKNEDSHEPPIFIEAFNFRVETIPVAEKI